MLRSFLSNGQGDVCLSTRSQDPGQALYTRDASTGQAWCLGTPSSQVTAIKCDPSDDDTIPGGYHWQLQNEAGSPSVFSLKTAAQRSQLG